MKRQNERQTKLSSCWLACEEFGDAINIKIEKDARRVDNTNEPLVLLGIRAVAVRVDVELDGE